MRYSKRWHMAGIGIGCWYGELMRRYIATIATLVELRRFSFSHADTLIRRLLFRQLRRRRYATAPCRASFSSVTGLRTYAMILRALMRAFDTRHAYIDALHFP